MQSTNDLAVIDSPDAAALATSDQEQDAAASAEALQQQEDLAGPTDIMDGVVSETIALGDFMRSFGASMLEQVKASNPPVYQPVLDQPLAAWQARQAVMASLRRKPFPAQSEAVQAVCKLLLDRGEPAAVLNAEMGSGKTMMAICAAAVIQQEHPRTLIVSPPHLVYKWRREIMETVPGAKVWVLNGPDTLRKLLQLRATLGLKSRQPEFYVLGRVRMRMGFHWKPAFITRRMRDELQTHTVACCPQCMAPLDRIDGEGARTWMSAELAAAVLSDQRMQCTVKTCRSPLWTLIRPGTAKQSLRDLVGAAMQQLPTIGPVASKRLLDMFGESLLGSMLEDNVYEFINLMDENGNMVFSDRQARRLERSMATFEFSIGQGGYQATEFIKRYLPKHHFGLLVVDEGHEYKNEGSAQGQAMGVLASQCRKTLLLTGTLMGGYADDLFHLLWRLNPAVMVADGFKPSERGSFHSANMAFMREHGVLKDVYRETGSSSHRTAKAKSMTVRTSKAPGFGPVGILRYVLPITVFLKLREIEAKALPPYEEVFEPVQMEEAQGVAYAAMAANLVRIVKQALAMKDSTLLGVVMNVLLAWPDCCFRPETVRHPRTRAVLHMQPAMFDDSTLMPKEVRLVEICKQEKAAGRRVLAYTIYSGTRDTTARLRNLLEVRGFKVAVLRASVDASKREDWVADQVERGVDVVLCNPELVKTGLDLLEFPTIVFMQSGFNVYTVQQAARRSWRIGQRKSVKVFFLGYAGTTQMDCLRLMGKKIAVSQSTSGDMPESGLDVLNDSQGDSLEVTLAKELLAAA